VLHRALSELLALLAPPVCATCRAPLGRGDELLCPVCRRAVPWLRGARCRRCGLPAPCGPCPAARAAFEMAWSPVAYDGSARELVAALKFRAALPVVEVMAAQMAAGAPASLLTGATLVPVPLHPTRRRRRGFDQAQRLANALATRTGLPVSACLRRTGASTRQLGASRAERQTAGRIDVRAIAAAPHRALLVDDVHTTGATLDACARALKAAGARHVDAITYARTLR
jgi:ComF family protein